MKFFSNKAHRKQGQHKHGKLNWLLYLPGAIIISYGFWLSLTSQMTS